LNLWHPTATHKDEGKFKSISRMEVWP